MKKMSMVGVFGLLAAAASGCSNPTSTEDDAALVAKELFWSTFRDGRVDEIPAARDAMIAALATHPDDFELARWVGFSFALGGRGPDEDADPQARFDEMVHYGEMAVDMATDPRDVAYNSGLLGGFVFTRGEVTNNEADRERGRAILEQVTRELPAFGFATRGDVMSSSPVGSADFASSVESYFRFFEQCTGTAIDRDDPDLSAVLRRPFADADTTCTNWEHAEHGIQGFLLIFGDALVKNGQTDAARSVYAIIPQTEGYDSWSFAGEVEARLASDLEARAAQYGTGDPRREPQLGVGCGGCHYR